MVSKTRDTLLAAAAQLLDEGGPEAVTLREVGHRAGVSHNAPYKHFADKEALLAAVAARELDRSSSALSATVAGPRPAGADVQAVMRGYVAWAMEYPQRFKLVYGSWSKGSDELAAAAGSARTLFTGVVIAAQRTGQLPAGDPERLSSLLLALTHGAVDLALAGHLSPTGKGHATPAELADDLLGYLRAAAQREAGPGHDGAPPAGSARPG
jgi:AcrR family transcriptional regulator